MTSSKIEKIKIFAEMALSHSKLSKDPSTKVGALILRPNLSICSGGYNGMPIGYPETPEIWENRELKYKIVKHAEENAILFSTDPTLSGYIMIVTHFPCPLCAGDMVQRGIKELYYINDPRPDHSCEEAVKVLKSGMIHIEQIKL